MPVAPAVHVITLQLAGAPQAHAGARRAALAPPDALMLAWLALEGPTARERIAALLWPASDAEAARNALRQRLFRLRKQWGDELVTGSAVLALGPGVCHDLDAATSVLGDLLPAEAPELEAWLGERRAAALAQSRQAVEDRIDALEGAGDTAAALAEALALLVAHPQSEDAHRRVMRLHYLRGDRAAALLAFDRCEELLKHEVGTAPSAATLALLATIEDAAPLAGAPAAARGAVPAAVLRPPRLVGRDGELAALQRGIAAGHVLVLVGEAGMGKSRLLQALAGARSGVLHASGRPGDNLVPYATIARALRQLLDREPTLADATLRRSLAPLLPEFVSEYSQKLQPPLAQPVLTLLQRAGRVVEVLALDDLHFADDATLELLQALLTAPRAEAAPRDGFDAAPRWCLGLRPAPPGSRLQGLLDALGAAGPHTRLVLQPLSEAQLAEFVDTLALPGIEGRAVAATLHQRTGGNPLFALETLKLAWHEGTLSPQQALAEGLPRPDSLTQLIGQQLARLSAAALQLARVAAVAGVDFSIPLAESLLGKSVLDLADAWSELETQQVLRGDGFAHDLVHDAVLQGIPEVIARHLHGQTAGWLERQDTGQRGAEPTSKPADAWPHAGDPARVAAHWEAAGQRARALPALRAAARRAQRALRAGEYIDFLLHAADIAEAAGDAEQAFDLVHDAVEAHMDTIRQADGLPLLDRLEAMARTPLQQARAAIDRAWYLTVLSDLVGAVTLCEAALTQALPLGNEELLAKARQRLGTTLSMAGRFEDALPHMHAAEPWITAHGSDDELSTFQGNLAVVLDNLGRPADAQDHHLRALALSLAQGDQAQHATQLANYASSRLDAGDVAGAAAQAAQAQRIVTTYEMAGASAGFIALLQSQCERGRGCYGAALEWCDRAEAILAERNPSRVPVARLQRAQVWLDLGQHTRALQVLGGAALEAARAMPARYAVRWLVLLARLQRRLKQDADALLDVAAAQVPSHGWPELGLIVRTEQALGLPLPAALDALKGVVAQAQELRLHGAELGALLQATWLLAQQREPAALPLAQRALALAASAEALQTDRALRWLAPAAALAGAGQAAEALAVAQAGQDWLRTAASAHMAPEFAPSFLQQHPLNAVLLSWRAA